jgi:hypothetical protein
MVNKIYDIAIKSLLVVPFIGLSALAMQPVPVGQVRVDLRSEDSTNLYVRIDREPAVVDQAQEMLWETTLGRSPMYPQRMRTQALQQIDHNEVATIDIGNWQVFVYSASDHYFWGQASIDAALVPQIASLRITQRGIRILNHDMNELAKLPLEK